MFSPLAGSHSLASRRSAIAFKALAAALATAFLASACARGTGSTAATPTPTASATPRAHASAPPRPVNTPAAPAGVLSPAALSSRAAAAPALPQILGASVSPTVVGSGTVVHAVVRTTPGVVTVVAYAGGTSIAVPRVGPGRFEGSTTLPPLPPFARGSYAVTFVARDARGASTQSAVGVRVR